MRKASRWKAKRLVGRVRVLHRESASRVEQWLLLTRDAAGVKPDPVRRVPVGAVRTLPDPFREGIAKNGSCSRTLRIADRRRSWQTSCKN